MLMTEMEIHPQPAALAAAGRNCGLHGLNVLSGRRWQQRAARVDPPTHTHTFTHTHELTPEIDNV